MSRASAGRDDPAMSTSCTPLRGAVAAIVLATGVAIGVPIVPAVAYAAAATVKPSFRVVDPEGNHPSADECAP